MNIRKVFGTYMVATMYQAGLSFLIFPYLTHYLSTGDFGIIALVNTYVTLIGAVAGMGCEGYFYINFFKAKPEEKSDYFLSSYYIPLISFLSIAIILVIFSVPLAKIVELTPLAIVLIALLSLANFLYEQTLGLLIYNKKSLIYSIVIITKTSLEVLLTAFAVIYFKEHWQGRIFAWLISIAIFGFWGLSYIYRSGMLNGKLNKQITKESFRYGFPFVFHQLSKFSMNQSDRIFLSKLTTITQTGIYNVAYQIGSVVNMVNLPFNNFFAPHMMEGLANPTPEKKKQIVKIAYSYILFLIVIVGLTCVLAEIMYAFFINPNFIEGKKIVPLVGLAYFFWGIYLIFSGILQFEKKSKLISTISIVAFAINLILNYFMIKEYGYMGAAWATLITFAFQAASTAYYAHQTTHLPWLSFFRK